MEMELDPSFWASMCVPKQSNSCYMVHPTLEMLPWCAISQTCPQTSPVSNLLCGLSAVFPCAYRCFFIRVLCVKLVFPSLLFRCTAIATGQDTNGSLVPVSTSTGTVSKLFFLQCSIVLTTCNHSHDAGV